MYGDIAHPYRSSKMETYMQEVGIRRLDCLTQNSDLDQIEYVCGVLKKRVRSAQPASQNIRELKSYKVTLFKIS